MTDESKTEMLKQIDDFRKKSKMQIPDIERTIIKLSEQPREAGLWARLIQRVAGWGLGVAQARTLPPTLQWYQGLRHCHSASTIHSSVLIHSHNAQSLKGAVRVQNNMVVAQSTLSTPLGRLVCLLRCFRSGLVHAREDVQSSSHA